MKPRPIPTSPKHRSAQDEIDQLYHTEPTIVKPAEGSVALSIIIILISVAATLAAFIGLRMLAQRFPDKPILKYFNGRSQERERVIVREQSQKQELTGALLAEKIAPSLATIVRERTKAGARPLSDRLGLATLLSSDGVAVTTADTLDRSSTNVVRTSEGDERTVRFTRTDPATTLTLTSVEGTTTPLALSELDRLTVGSAVWVIRNDPYAGGVSVVPSTVVATRDRVLSNATVGSLFESSEMVSRRIRLDRSLDGAWKGAAVVDADARLIGLVVPGEAQSGALVIPATFVQNQLSRFSRNQDIVRPVLGVNYLDLSYTTNLPNLPTKGANVAGNDQLKIPAVLPRSPAAAAGIREGDVITAVDGKPLNELHSLSEAIVSYEAGTKLTLTVLRGKSSLDISVTLGTSSAGG